MLSHDLCPMHGDPSTSSSICFEIFERFSAFMQFMLSPFPPYAGIWISREVPATDEASSSHPQ